jgi:pimeloyl-ACP methyl ester carboxylesterase
MHQHIYCISGLGADFRIFEKLNIQRATLHPIQWEVPSAEDTLATYANKLSTQIVHPNAILLGVSFGGMLATEISKIVDVQKTIIVSSCKQRNELPLFLRTAGKLRLHKAFPFWLVARSNAISKLIFDTRSQAEALMLKRIMLQQSDLTFLKRSVHMILNWQATQAPENIIHIHGKKDRLLTPFGIRPKYWISNGGHFMIWNEAEQISTIIQQEI